MNNILKKTFYIISFFMVITSFLLWIVIPEEITLNISTSVFSLTLLGASLYGDRENLIALIRGQKFKNFRDASITGAFLFCLLGLLNYLTYKHPKQWDLTYGKRLSITKQSRDIIKSFKEPVVFKIFTRKKNRNAFLLKLEQYRLENNLIKIEFIDIDLHPELVKKFNVAKEDTLLVLYKGKQAFIEELSELGITNALLRVKNTSRPKIYYTIGHQELDFNSREGHGILALKQSLENLNYELFPLELTLTQSIPEDADLLMIIGPQSEFMPVETQQVDEFLLRGGSLFVAIDPNPNGDRGKNLRGLLKTWNFDIANNFVIDRLKFIQGSDTKIPMVNKWESDHKIVKGFKQSVFFPLVSSIEYLGDEKETVLSKKGDFFKLAETSLFPASWAEQSISEFIAGKMFFKKGVDIKGPITLFAAWKSHKKNTRIILSGNSSFMTNTYEKYAGNHHLVTNAISWLINEEKLIAFDTPSLKSGPVFIAPRQLSLIFIFTVILMPLVFISMGIFVYKRRAML